MSPKGQKVMAEVDAFHKFTGCQPTPEHCVVCDLISRVRLLEEALSDCIHLMSGASSDSLNQDTVLKKARKAYYGEE